MKAVLLISHGSRSLQTEREVVALLEKIKLCSGADIHEFAFLEIQKPDIPEGIDLCVGQGADEIIVLLNFLNSGRHVDRDIPRIIDHARKRHPNVSILVTIPVGQHEGIVGLLSDMIQRPIQVKGPDQPSQHFQ